MRTSTSCVPEHPRTPRLADTAGGLMNILLTCSARTPPAAIFPAYDLVVEMRSSAVRTSGGFQTSLEQDCLDILLKGSQHVTICPARSVASVKTLYKGALWKSVKQGMAEGRVTLESPFPDKVRRATKQTAIVRNTWMVERADAVLI